MINVGLLVVSDYGTDVQTIKWPVPDTSKYLIILLAEEDATIY